MLALGKMRPCSEDKSFIVFMWMMLFPDLGGPWMEAGGRAGGKRWALLGSGLPDRNFAPATRAPNKVQFGFISQLTENK